MPMATIATANVIAYRQMIPKVLPVKNALAGTAGLLSNVSMPRPTYAPSMNISLCAKLIMSKMP